MPLVYFDNCALQRPLDDRTQLRVRLEAETIESLLEAIEFGDLDLLASDVLVAESQAAPQRDRRDFAAKAIALASTHVHISPTVKQQAAAFCATGIKPFDALHLASACAGEAAYLCTTDDRFLRKAQRANPSPLRVVGPIELAYALDL